MPAFAGERESSRSARRFRCDRRFPFGVSPRTMLPLMRPDEIAAVTEDYRRTAGFALAALSTGDSLLDAHY